jgi:hypothetical protein
MGMAHRIGSKIHMIERSQGCLPDVGLEWFRTR